MSKKIGDYIHLHYEHYKKFGLNQRSSGIEETPNSAEIFSQHHQDMMKDLRAYKNKNSKVKEGLERQLNYYYDLKRGTAIDNNLSQEDLKNIEIAISQYLGDKIKNVDINMDTLSSFFNGGQVNISNFSAELMSKLKNANKIGISNKSYVQKSTIQNRIDLLIKLRSEVANITNKNVNEEKLIDKINILESTWDGIKKDIISLNVKGNTKTARDNRNFIEELNSIIPGLIGGSSTVHGEYAEAMVVILNYLSTKGAARGVGDLMKALERGVKGQLGSQKALDLTIFDERFVDSYMFDNVYMKSEDGIVFRTHETQDKVDVVLEFEGLDIPASVKNYNMANPTTDVHLLSGRSVLMLTQQYPIFLNHYLNIVAEHKDEEPSANLLQQAHETMKLTILLKALAGGVFSKQGITSKADIFIVNDNSGASNDGYGAFSVYYISDIIDEVGKDLNLLKTGDYDKVTKLSNEFVMGENRYDLSRAAAKIRISNLLMQLHKQKLDVSVSKKVFTNLKTK